MQPKKILLVDDIEFATKMVSEIFKSLENELDIVLKLNEARSVAEARTHLEATEFDLVITDMHLSDGTGSEIAKMVTVKSSGKSSVVALTAMPKAYQEDEELFEAFITKPSDPQVLKARLAELVIKLKL